MKNDKFDYPFLFSYDETKKHYSVIEAIDIEEEIIHVQRGGIVNSSTVPKHPKCI